MMILISLLLAVPQQMGERDPHDTLEYWQCWSERRTLEHLDLAREGGRVQGDSWEEEGQLVLQVEVGSGDISWKYESLNFL